MTKPTAAHSPQPTAHSPQRFERWLRRLASPFVSLFLASALVACGGGDGGSATPSNPTVTCTAPQVNVNGVCTTPTTPPVVCTAPQVNINGVCTTPSNPATGTLNANGCTIPDGASFCNATASWSTQNAASPALRLNGMLVSSAASGNQAFPINHGTTTFALSNGTATLATVTASAVCGTNAAAVSGVCQPQPTTLRYTDIILANSAQYGWYPVKLVLTSGATSGSVTFSAEKAVNATRFQTGAWPLGNCGFNTTKLATGAVKLSCQDALSLARHELVWNPVTNQITEYDGSEGAYLAYSDATWIDTQFALTPPVAGWSAFAEFGTGWVWNSTTDFATLHFKRKSDGVDVVIPLSIGNVKAFGAFSN